MVSASPAPRQALIVGARWELSIDLVWVFGLLILLYVYLHRVDLPATWYAVASYALTITAICEAVHLVTSHGDIDDSNLVETVHLEILLPAFTVGCIVKHPHADHASRGDHRAFTRGKDGEKVERRMTTLRRLKNVQQESFKLCVSAVFMVRRHNGRAPLEGERRSPRVGRPAPRAARDPGSQLRPGAEGGARP